MKHRNIAPVLAFVLLIVRAESSMFVRKPRQSTADGVKTYSSISEGALISDLSIKSDVSVRFADVSVTSVVVNDAGSDQEVQFKVQLPLTAFISQFTMTIDGVTFVGEVMEKEAAKKLYREAQAANETAGHVVQDKYSPERRLDMDLFTTSVNIAANTSVIFELKYMELIDRRHGYYKQTINIKPNQIVPNFDMILTYNEPQGISSFAYKLPMKPNAVQGPFDDTDVTVSTGDTYRKFHLNMSVEKQALFNPTNGVDGDLVITYDVDHSDSLFSVKIVGPEEGSNGYVATYFSPPTNVYEVLPKDIVFVIDISGSMSAGKIEQARKSMLSILKKIRPVDRFNIVLFDDTIEVFGEGFLPGNEHYLLQAELYVKENVLADGSTNINDALMMAISMFGPHLQDPRGNVIVFLTDGNPNTGAATNPTDIRANVRNANYQISKTGEVEFKAVIYALGFGFDMDFAFLTNIAEENGGNARRIYEGVDAQDQLIHFFDEIADPFLTDITVSLCSGSLANEINVSENKMSKHEFPYYFSGSEIVIVAEVESLPETVGVCMNGRSMAGDVSLYYPSVSGISRSIKAEFIKRLYGYMQIKNLLRLKGITLDKNEANRYKQIALNMSLEYKFVTPLTSLVVTKAMRPHKQLPKSEELYPHGIIPFSVNTRKVNHANAAYNPVGASSEATSSMPMSGPVLLLICHVISRVRSVGHVYN